MVYFENSCTNGSAGYQAAGHDFFNSYRQNNWTQIAEAALPLKGSKKGANHGAFFASNGSNCQLQASVEFKSREISKKLIIVNLVSLIINLLLAIVGFYFSIVNNSSATSAFAADCVLDFISSAIVLWRYSGDLNSVHMQAREQIACIYLGSLFEISAVAIIVKATSDMVTSSTSDFGPETIGYDLVYLSIAATIACGILLVFKCDLYRTIRDNSILLDVINSLISTVFAMSIIMSQALINLNPSFWYLDPILSIILAMFMCVFGIKVIHQNFNILRPVCHSSTNGAPGEQNSLTINKSCHNRVFNNHQQTADAHRTGLLMSLWTQIIGDDHRTTEAAQLSNYSSNLNSSIDFNRAANNRNWQKTDYSTISFV